MVGEAVVHLVELLGVDALERLAHRGMQGLATRGKQIVVHDAPEPPMREIEALADGVKDATAYQLLDPLRAVAPAQAGRLLQHVEAELPLDHGGHGHEALALGAQAIEVGGEDLADPVGQREAGGGQAAVLLQGAHGLDDDEWVPAADRPHLLGQLGHPRATAARARQRAHEAGRAPLRQRREGDAVDVGFRLELVERSPESGRVGQLLFARGAHEEQGAGAQAPAHEREEAQAQLVRPVKILEHHDERASGGDVGDERVDDLEEPDGVFRDDLRLHARRAELRKEPDQLAAPGPREALEGLGLGQDGARAKRVHPGAKGQDLLGLVRAAEEDPATASTRLGGQLFDEAALADARLAREKENAPLTTQDLAERSAQMSYLLFPSDERALRRGLAGPGGAGRGPSLPLEDFLVDALGLGFRLDAQLLPQHRHAGLVLTEGGGPPTLAGEKTHERAVRALLKWIEREQSPRSLDGRLGRATLHLLGQEARQGLLDQLTETVALGPEPALEGLLVDAQPVEERAFVERDGGGEGGRGPLANQALEAGDVHIDGGGVDGDRLRLDDEAGIFCRREDLADTKDGLSEALSRLALADVAPEEGSQAFPRVRAAGAEGEICQEGLRLAGGEGERARLQPEVEAAQEPETQAWHR